MLYKNLMATPVENYQEFRPTPRLGRYVECYWSREDRDGTPSYCVLPDGCVDILFSRQNGEPAGLNVVGLMTTAMTLDIPPGQSFFGVRFRPAMASAFVPEAAQLNDRILPLEDLMPRAARNLLEQLAEAPNVMDMSRIMDTFLRPLEPPDAANKALHELGLTRLSLDEFATEFGLSTRQLRRVCADRAGVSPKFLVRILRTREAAARIADVAAKSTQPNWADLAVACGYYDQAHFIREFQQFTGYTPGRYLQSLA
jgi:AraC-like DNA-binding protein